MKWVVYVLALLYPIASLAAGAGATLKRGPGGSSASTYAAGPFFANTGVGLETNEDKCLVLGQHNTAIICDNASTSNPWSQFMWSIDKTATTTVESMCCSVGHLAVAWDSGDELDLCVVTHTAQQAAVTEVASGCVQMLDLVWTTDRGKTFCSDIGTELASDIETVGVQISTDTVDTNADININIGCRIMLSES